MSAQRTEQHVLLHRYREHVADLGTIIERDVYVGFSGVRGGTVLGLAGYLTYLWAEFGSVSWEMGWSLRKLTLGTVGFGVLRLLVGAITGHMGSRDLGRVTHAWSIYGLGLVIFRLGGAESCRLYG